MELDISGNMPITIIVYYNNITINACTQKALQYFVQRSSEEPKISRKNSHQL